MRSSLFYIPRWPLYIFRYVSRVLIIDVTSKAGSNIHSYFVNYFTFLTMNRFEEIKEILLKFRLRLDLRLLPPPEPRIKKKTVGVEG